MLDWVDVKNCVYPILEVWCLDGQLATEIVLRKKRVILLICTDITPYMCQQIATRLSIQNNRLSNRYGTVNFEFLSKMKPSNGGRMAIKK